VQFYCMKDAAHWPQWEHPEEHDRVVTAFLKG
jgi:pimeloyl-ACP methyl ester carboxylesterase